MKKIIKIFLMVLGFSGIAFIIFLGWLAHFTTIHMPQDIYLDGFGRELYPTPALLQILSTDRMYPGFKWFIFDIIAFLALAGISSVALYFSDKLGRLDFDKNGAIESKNAEKIEEGPF